MEAPQDLLTLLPEESQALQYLVAGMSDKDIAHAFNVSELTMRARLKALRKKIDAKSRLQAAVWAYDRGVRGPEDMANPQARVTPEEVAQILASLTARERQILECLTHGMVNKAIGRQLHIVEGTVKIHMKAIFAKIRLRNRVQAALWARENEIT